MIKKIIKICVIFVNDCLESIKNSLLIKRIIIRPLNFYNNILILYGPFIFILKVIIIIFIFSWKGVLIGNYFKVCVFLLIIFIFRYPIRSILYLFGWTGKEGYVEYLPELKKLYNKNFVIKKIMNFLYFYGNIWYIVPYLKKSNNIIVNISINFIFYVLKEIYLPIKKKIITGKLLNIINIRLLIVIIILLFGYPVIPIIVVWLIVKMIKAIWLEMELSLGIITKLDKNCKQRELLISIKKEYNIFSKNVKHQPKKLIVEIVEQTLEERIDEKIKEYDKFKISYLNKLNDMNWLYNLVEFYYVYNKKELCEYKEIFKEFEEKKLKNVVKEWADIIKELNKYLDKDNKLKIIFSTSPYLVTIKGHIKVRNEDHIKNILSKDELNCLKNRINIWYDNFGDFIDDLYKFESQQKTAYLEINTYMTIGAKKNLSKYPLEVVLWLNFFEIDYKYFKEIDDKVFEVIIRSDKKNDFYYDLIWDKKQYFINCINHAN